MGRRSPTTPERGYDGLQAPESRPNDRGGRPLDPDRPTPRSERPDSEPARPSDGPADAGGDAAKDPSGAQGATEAPGLIAQVKATRDALLGMLRAHVALGKAEAEAIKGEVVYTAAFVGVAIAVLLLLGIFLPIAALLFTGEWLFGSIGWGLLLGSELLVAVAVTAVVVGLRLAGPAAAAAIGVAVGAVAFIVLGASWLNRLWAWIGDSTNVALDPASRPLVVAIVVVGAVGGLVGLIAGARAAGTGGAVGGLIAGLVAGCLAGAFLATDFGWRVGAALGLAVAFAAYLGVLASRVASAGIDTEKIKQRFWPQQTIDTARETIEWAKAQNPLGPKS